MDVLERIRKKVEAEERKQGSASRRFGGWKMKTLATVYDSVAGFKERPCEVIKLPEGYFLIHRESDAALAEHHGRYVLCEWRTGLVAARARSKKDLIPEWRAKVKQYGEAKIREILAGPATMNKGEP